MPRKFFKRISPSIEAIKDKPGLVWIQPHLIKYQLLSFTRHSISKAVFIGLFVAALPPLPIQMLIASVLAVLFRANLPISVATVWVSNPLTIGPILLLEWWLGSLILGQSLNHADFDLTNWWELAGNIGVPLITGSLVWALISATLGYLSIKLIWRFSVLSRRRSKKTTGKQQ